MSSVKRTHRLRIDLLDCWLVAISRACLACLVVLVSLGKLHAQARPNAEGRLLPAAEAARTMRVPEGFQVTLFAGEPDVQQPIGFCIDDRGRLWVAEAYNYPNHGTTPGDRIVILEDTDGDGCHDKRTVFYDGLNYVTGIEVGFGGAWVMSPPYFYFIPDHDRDDRPDAAPQVLLDGFGNHENAHNLANGFAWGLDGWLYGTHGRTNWSMIGKPGCNEDERQRFDGGVYRYHPIRHVWEPYADGTTNPWGIDWNDRGHAFVTNCVNPHLFQVLQGAHYEPWRNRASSQFAYQRIDTIADHFHFVGLSGATGGLGSAEEDTAGGGHAHCGTMIYQGDNFPPAYRNTIFTNNIHGRRINNDILRRRGSGYVASHGADLMRSEDEWFMGVTLAYGPAGEVYVSDWSDTGECHSVRNTQRQTGRIYRITFGDVRRPPVDLVAKSNAELVQLHLHPNEWYVRHARRLLQERLARGNDMRESIAALRALFETQEAIPMKLRAMWSLHVCRGLDDAWLEQALRHSSEDVRSWAVTLITEDASSGSDNGKLSEGELNMFAAMAREDASPLVRLGLAIALQRLPFEQRWTIAEALLLHVEDNEDQNLPLMTWYGVEPLLKDDLPRYIQLAAQSRIRRVHVNMARRASSSDQSTKALELLVDALNRCEASATVGLMQGVQDGLAGRKVDAIPGAWPAAFRRLQGLGVEPKRLAWQLGAAMNDPHSLDELQRVACDPQRETEERRASIELLCQKRFKPFEDALLRLVEDSSVRSSAIRGLAAFDHQQTATKLLDLYDTLTVDERQLVQSTLAAKARWAEPLLDHLATRRTDGRDQLTAYTARQIKSLGDSQLDEKLRRVWGEVRDSSGDVSKRVTAIRRWLTPANLAQADQERGHQLFKKHCANCHTFFGEGGKIGPDITGSQRMNIDYLLETILDPNATVAKDYQMTIVRTTDDRVLNGLIESQSDETIVIQTATERVVIEKAAVAEMRLTQNSIMPLGLLDSLSESETRDLISYLQRAP